MLDRLFRKKKRLKIIWGIWVDPSVKLCFKALAQQLRVPISILVTDILMNWLSRNAEALLSDNQKRNAYAEYLVRKYLKKPEN